MGLFLFLIFILVTNIAIGYVIATLFGMGPPNLRTALVLINRSKFVTRAKDVVKRLVRSAENNGGILGILRFILSKLKKFITKGTASELQQKQETTEEKLQKISEKEVVEFLDDQSKEIMRISPIPELFDDNLMNIIFVHGTEVWLTSDKNIETSIHKLNVIMMESGKFAGELDEKLRLIQGHATLDDARKACKNLVGDCRNYLEKQSIITDEIHSRVEEFGELRDLADEVDFANMEQVSQIETTLSNLEPMAKNENANEVVDRLIQELANLRRARHRTRDIQDRVFLSVANYENRMGSINRSETFIDQVTGLNNRIAFQTNLWDWWQQERQKKAKLTFALYDIVGFTELNNRLGIRKCDKILQALAQLLKERVENMDFIGMFVGNCLVSVSSNSSLRKTISFVEHIRQETELTQFMFADENKQHEDHKEHGGVSIRLTCAVTEASGNQTENDLITALRQTLEAAKKAGRNRTFQFDPSKLEVVPEPVESPDMNVSERVFDVTNMRLMETAVV